MAKAELKTKVNDASVTEFLDSVADEQKRNDCFEILKMMKQVTKEEPKMWGASIVGFGSYHYKGKSGREGDWMLTGFSPRKQNLTLYLMGGFDTHADLLKQTGQIHNRRRMLIYQVPGRCGQEGPERAGAGICQENVAA